MRRAQAWNLSDPSTLEGYPRDAPYRTSDVFQKVQAGTLAQLNERLSSLATREEPIREGATGLQIEYILRRLGKLTKSRRTNQHFHRSESFDQLFTPEQKTFIYRTLLELEETAPTKSIDYYRIFGLR